VPYPWAKYAQVVVLDFIWGGMENTSATTLYEGVLEGDQDGLIVHELAHQWFGDLVTCRTWSEIWLNEGFATYVEHLWAEHTGGADAMAEEMLGAAADAIEESDTRYARPIVTDCYTHPDDMFDSHSYPKGAWVLHMLRGLVGDDAWWRGVNLYLKRHAHGNVVTDDLRRAMEEAGGRKLDAFFDQWLHKAGIPELTVSHRWEPGTLQVSIEQTHRRREDIPLFAMPVEVVVDGTAHAVWIRGERTDVILPAGRVPALVEVDPRGRLLARIVWKKESKELVAQLEKSAHVPSRVWAARQLGEIQDEWTATALEKALLEDRSLAVREACAEALGGIDEGVLLHALPQVKEPRVRRAILAALGESAAQEEVAVALMRAGREERDPGCRAAAWAGYGRRPTVFETLAKAAEEFAKEPRVLTGILDGLVATKDARAAAIVVRHAAYGMDPRVRGKAVELLGALGDKTRLAALLDDPAYSIRAAAAGALEACGGAAEAGALEKRAKVEVDGQLMQAMKRAARKIRSRS
jgi:aminopeptidase N